MYLLPSFFVEIDGSTAEAPEGFTYATVGKVFHSIPGETIQLEQADGSPHDIFLPQIADQDFQTLSMTEATIVGFGDSSMEQLEEMFPEEDPAIFDELQLTIAAGNAVDESGNSMTEATIIVVSPDRTPTPLPPGADPSLVISIQVPGANNFDTPAPIRFPNLDGQAPGEKTAIYSFDHDLGDWIIIGTGTVTEDGTAIVSDPGVGILAPGWHFPDPWVIGRGDRPRDPWRPGGPIGPGPGPGGPGPGGPGPGPCIGPDCGDPWDPETPHETMVDPIPVTMGIQDYFFDDDDGSFTLSFRNDADPINPELASHAAENIDATPLVIDITVDGSPDDFLNGLLSFQSLQLLPGQSQDIMVDIKDLLGDIKDIEEDRLYGAKVTIEGYKFGELGDLLIDQEFFIYRFLDAADDNHTDGIVEFADTINDGLANIQRARPLNFLMPNAIRPTLTVADATNFDFLPITESLLFDPRQTQENLMTTLTIASPNGNTVGTLEMLGDGTPKFQLFVNKPDLITTLANIANGTAVGINANLTAAEIELFDNLAADGVTAAPNERSNLADEIEDAIYDLYSSFSAGIELANAASTSSVNFNWETTATDLFFGTSAPDGVDNFADQTTVVNNRNMNSRTVNNFLLSEATNQDLTSDVRVFVDSHLEWNLNGQGDLSRAELINALAYTAAHEGGHTLGLNHTAQNALGPGNTTMIAQEVSIGGVMGRNDIMFGGNVDFTGNNSFLANLTAELLKVGLHIGWTLDEAQTALSFLVAQRAIGGGFSTLNAIGVPDQEEPEPIPGPRLAIFDAATQLIFEDLDLGTVLVDDVGNEQNTDSLTFVNFGSEDVILNEINLIDENNSFAITSITPETVIAPGERVAFDITFDALTSGLLDATLQLDTNDPSAQTEINLTGFGLSPFGDIDLEVLNNNVGGVGLSSGVANFTDFATIRNIGASSLTISDIVSSEGQFSILNLPTDPLILAPGETFDVDVSFDPETIGFQGTQLQIFSDDPDTPLFSQTVIGTGEGDTGPAFEFGSDFVLFEANGEEVRIRSDVQGQFSVNLTPDTPYILRIFDPESGLISQQAGVSASAGEFTDFGPPTFVVDTSNDSNDNGLPDIAESIIGEAWLFDFRYGELSSLSRLYPSNIRAL